MDPKAHWQAFYNTIRESLDDAGFGAVQVVHVTSKDQGPLSEVAVPPFVAYANETSRTTGTMGGGSLKVLRDGWRVEVRAADLDVVLDIAKPIINGLVDADISTEDGYETTALDLIGNLTVYEGDSELYAAHVRFMWERSS